MAQNQQKRFLGIKNWVPVLTTAVTAIVVILSLWIILQQVTSSRTYSTPHFSSFYINSTSDSLKNYEESRGESADMVSVYNLMDKTESSSSSGEATESTGKWWGYPADILPCTRSGDDLLVLVNKQYQLPSTYAPSDLVSINNSGIRTTKSGLYVRSIVIGDLTEMVQAASSVGIDIAALSAYRTYATQQSTYNYWVAYNGGNTDAADQVSARAGHSQHQLGTAIDFTTNEIGDQLGSQFGGTAAANWLASNAWKYGFVLAFPAGWESTTGFSYEAWHFRYIGKGNASEWHKSGQILELWLRGKN